MEWPGPREEKQGMESQRGWMPGQVGHVGPSK